MSDGFYRAFEEKYRGSRELIKSRLYAYLPFVEPLAALDICPKAIDLGCGRGEWLELLAGLGFEAQGVDLNDGMLRGCLELGLSVLKGDAVVHLAALPSESQTIVSAFHVVEHISFEQLQSVVSEALRVLRPGGLLIMETPNPENIVVSTRDFYLDPTHQRPIPPQLLSFLPEYCGFARVKTVRLQESKSLMQSGSLTLHDVLDGVSPDYAVIAQKSAAADVFRSVDSAFEHEYGWSLATLADRYASQIETKAQGVEVQIQRAESIADRAEEQAQQAVSQANRAEAQVQQAASQADRAEARAQQAVIQADRAEAQIRQAVSRAEDLHHALHAMINSRSWRITAPLRWLALNLKLLFENGFVDRLSAYVKKTKHSAVRWCLVFLETHPSTKAMLLRLARRLGIYRFLYSKLAAHFSYTNALASFAKQSEQSSMPDELKPLSPRTRQIYADLESAIRNKRDTR